MDALIQDLRYALRRIVGAPVTTAVAVAVLALGIGTSAVVLTVIDGILFGAPPGVGSSEDMVEIWSASESRFGIAGLTFVEVQALEELDAFIDEVGAYLRTGVGLGSGEQPEMVIAELVSEDYFAAADVALARGSGFSSRAGGDEGTAVAVLGHAHWRDRLGSGDVVGQVLEVNGQSFVVVGVAPERFYGVGGSDDPVAIWLPLDLHDSLFPSEASLAGSGARRLRAVARLSDGVTISRAEEAVGRAWQAVQTPSQGVTSRDASSPGISAPGSSPSTASRQAAPPPGSAPQIRQASITPYRGPGSTVMAAGGAVVGISGGLVAVLVLLIACANVSGLLLGRSLRRSKEIGVRLTLGAGRRRIIRQLLTESVFLSVVGGGAGVVITLAVLDTLERGLFTFPVELAPHPLTLALVLATAAVAGVAAGLAPALHATRSSVFTALKDQAAGLSRRASLLREVFTVGQLALGLPLLTAAWLLATQALDQGADLGLDHAQELAGAQIHFSGSDKAPEEVEVLLQSLRERVVARPDIQSASFSSVPPVLFTMSPWYARPGSPGTGAQPPRPGRLMRVSGVDPEYFSTVGLPIVRGRGIQPSDVPGAPLVVVVDEQVARTEWGGEDPLGRTVTVVRGDDETAATVVGVARSIREGPRPVAENRIVYAPRRQLTGDFPYIDLVVRRGTEGGTNVGEALRAEVRTLDPDLPVNVWSLPELLRRSGTELTHASMGASIAALVALLLACIGLYGMIAAGVTDRSREIGVRMALGADAPRIVMHFVQRGVTSTLWALAVGLPLAFVTVAMVGTSVVGVEAFSAEVALGLGGVALLMLLVGSLSSWLPARRGSSLDPVEVLRVE